MHKTKKKSKTAKLPKPIKVKKEKSDEDRLPQPMTHYLDDRLEMVKQIFNTLKPKTIVNLAPDFLKTQALEDIEESCLNELLCISTKRLKSIITDTKCPTDTESSDNDSDVERHEEHISLEEISSDSEIEGSTSKKVRKKKTAKSGLDTAGSTKDKPNEDNQGDGQISVLELLELQARARAIRSQLALEPVTKIEVDSDGEKRNGKETNKSAKRDDKANKSERKRLSSERDSQESAKQSRLNGSTESLNAKGHTEKDAEKGSLKKVKIKRNYRSTTNARTEESDQHAQGIEKIKEDKQKSDKIKSKEKTKERESNKAKETLSTVIKKEKTSRSPSPDVIPIVAEPETLLITDSSEEDNNLGSKNGSLMVSSEKNTSEQNTLTHTESQINETDNREAEKDLISCAAQKANEAQSKLDVLPSAENSACTESSLENTQDSEYKIRDKKFTEYNNVKNKSLKLSSKDKSRSNDGTTSPNHSDDDQNEDVISLGGDLENEMNEQLENEVNAMQSPHYNKKPIEDSSQDNNKSQDESQHDDVISLESSEDERANDNQSWHSRYMQSSKVSKVLATSRLGKRVRDKIKKSKHSKKVASHENLDAEKEKSTPVLTSKHEDGSIEQYKELLEMRQRKSS